ncbi:MAG: DUF2490 domain-containing protein [Crocinitomix sp.]|nr:DUF2490 domain-containing protein [Crocinitomix sp.]
MQLIQKAFLLCAIIFIIPSSFSQDGFTYVSQDLESWNTIGLKYKVNKKFSFGLEQGIRLNQNASTVDQVLTDLSFKLKPTPYLNFGLGLRYVSDRGGNDVFDNDFRFNLDAIFKHKVKSFSFKYRVRYQNRNEIGLSTAEGDYFKNYFRFKAGAEFNINKWKLDPVLSAEIFRDMTKYTGGFDKVRFTLGTSYSLKKFGEIDAFYRIEKSLGTNYPKTTYIIGLGYTFTLKNKNND